MKKLFSLTFLFLLFWSLSAFAMEKTWTGKISDSHCGATHKTAMLEKHAKEKTGDAAQKGKVDARECTQLCVKDGAKYVFAARGKVYEIENQDFAGLQEHAGHTVKLTGEMNANGKGIKVSNITMPAHSEAKKKY
jgi:hypothetical protein